MTKDVAWERARMALNQDAPEAAEEAWPDEFSLSSFCWLQFSDEGGTSLERRDGRERRRNLSSMLQRAIKGGILQARCEETKRSAPDSSALFAPIPLGADEWRAEFSRPEPRTTVETVTTLWVAREPMQEWLGAEEVKPSRYVQAWFDSAMKVAATPHRRRETKPEIVAQFVSEIELRAKKKDPNFSKTKMRGQKEDVRRLLRAYDNRLFAKGEPGDGTLDEYLHAAGCRWPNPPNRESEFSFYLELFPEVAKKLEANVLPIENGKKPASH